MNGRDLEGIGRQCADICLGQKLPIIGDYFIKETPPSDNVSLIHPSFSWVTADYFEAFLKWTTDSRRFAVTSAVNRNKTCSQSYHHQFDLK